MCIRDRLKQAFTHGVLYLDGGWRTLIEGLHAVAVAAGAEAVSYTHLTLPTI